MKKTFLFLFTFFSSMLLYSQSITGQWNGVLKVPGGQLRVVFHIVKTDTGFSSTMDSPDQGAKGIPVTQTSFDGQNLKLEITAAQIEYTGQLKNDTITGVFYTTWTTVSDELNARANQKTTGQKTARTP